MKQIFVWSSVIATATCIVALMPIAGEAKMRRPLRSSASNFLPDIAPGK